MTSLNPSRLTKVNGLKTLVKVRLRLASVDESIKKRNRCPFLKGLNNKFKKLFTRLLEEKLNLNIIFMGWVMQEPIYSLNYVLEHMDLMRNWVDVEVEKVSECVICAMRTVKVWVTFCGIVQRAVHYFLSI